MFFSERFSCRKFDPFKKITLEDLQLLQESIRMSPSSLNFQPWKIFCLGDDPRRKDLVQYAKGNVSQVLEASHLFIFCAETQMSEEEKEKRIQFIVQSRNLDENRYRKFLETTLPKNDFEWAKNQIYLALGFLIATASLLKLDHCPMEGFEEEGFNKILNLKHYRSVILCSVGYGLEKRSRKIRLKKEDIYF